MKKVKVRVGETEFEVGVEEIADNKLKISIDDEEHIVDVSEEGAKGPLEESKIIKAPMPGTISQILVQAGQSVKKGDPLIMFLAMKMENSILAPASGKVKEICVKGNEAVETGQVLLVLE
jgi:biotin carboxyl carrier protein